MIDILDEKGDVKESALHNWMLDELARRGKEIKFNKNLLVVFRNSNQQLRKMNKRLRDMPEKLERENEELRNRISTLGRMLDAAYAALAPFARHALYVEDDDNVAISAEETGDGWDMLTGKDLHRAKKIAGEMETLAGKIRDES